MRDGIRRSGLLRHLGIVVGGTALILRALADSCVGWLVASREPLIPPRFRAFGLTFWATGVENGHCGRRHALFVPALGTTWRDRYPASHDHDERVAQKLLCESGMPQPEKEKQKQGGRKAQPKTEERKQEARGKSEEPAGERSKQKPGRSKGGKQPN